MLGNVVTQIVVLFLIMGVGLACVRLHYLDQPMVTRLNALVLNVCLPAMIVDAASGQGGSFDQGTALMAIGCSAAMCVLMPALAWLLNRIMRVPRDQRAEHALMVMYRNTGFMGYPVVEAFFGTPAMFLNSMATLFQTTMCLVAGALMLPRDEGDAAQGGRGRAILRRVSWRKILSAPLVASLVALAIFLLGLRLPAFLAKTIASVGAITSPLAMMLIGASLASMNLRSLLTNWKLHVFVLLKQFVVPLAFWLVARPLFASATLLGVVTLTLAMPVAAMTMPLVDSYGRNTELVSRGIVASTLWSLVTLPVLGVIIA